MCGYLDSMGTLSSSSTDAEVWAAFDDNASYEEDGSRTKCLAFITACRILLRRRPSAASRTIDGLTQSMQYDARQIAADMAAAQRWVALHPPSSTPNVRFGDLQDFRGDFGY